MGFVREFVKADAGESSAVSGIYVDGGWAYEDSAAQGKDGREK